VGRHLASFGYINPNKRERMPLLKEGLVIGAILGIVLGIIQNISFNYILALAILISIVIGMGTLTGDVLRKKLKK